MYKSRKKHRLIGYDYSQAGYYFITICTNNRNMLFGEIQKDCRGTIFCALNKYGNIAKKYWDAIPDHYPCVTIDEYSIMPNHIHGIICINNGKIKNYTRTQDIVSLQNKFGQIIPGSLGSIIRGYKISVTKWFRTNTEILNVWQKSFYDEVIRTDKSLNNIREYIKNNPATWETDENRLLNGEVLPPLAGQAEFIPQFLMRDGRRKLGYAASMCLYPEKPKE